MPRARIEGSVGLQVVKLARADAGHEHAPDVAPAVAFRGRIDDFASARGRRRCRTATPAWPSAERLKTTNCTPPSWTIAPYGRGCVNRSADGRSVIARLLGHLRLLAPLGKHTIGFAGKTPSRARFCRANDQREARFIPGRLHRVGTSGRNLQGTHAFLAWVGCGPTRYGHRC